MDEIIQYIVESPENTNPNVMRSLLSKVEGSESSVDIPIMVVNIVNDKVIFIDRSASEMIEFFENGGVILTPVENKYYQILVNSDSATLYTLNASENFMLSKDGQLFYHALVQI